MKIDVGKDGPRVSVRETEDAGAWELEWTGDMGPRHARRMMQTAETIVLQNGGERIVLTCRAGQEALRAELDRWTPSTVSRSGDRYQLDIVVPGEDGFVHEDDDFRTPLARITCPTCVDRTARSRTKKREEALGKGKRAEGDSETHPAHRRGLHPAGRNRREFGNPKGAAAPRITPGGKPIEPAPQDAAALPLAPDRLPETHSFRHPGPPQPTSPEKKKPLIYIRN